MYQDEAFFIFKDKNSKNYNVFLAEFPETILPSRRVEKIQIDGRNGTLHESDGCYDSYSWSLICYGNFTASEIASWLFGTGYLTLSNNLNRRYKVTVNNSIDLETIAVNFEKFTLPLEVEPYVEDIEETIVNLGSSNQIEVPSTIDTPFILEFETISEETTISINNKEIKIENCNNLVIDTDLKIAYENNYVNAMSKITGNLEELILSPGTNIINLSGSYTNAKLKYRRRDLC